MGEYAYLEGQKGIKAWGEEEGSKRSIADDSQWLTYRVFLVTL